MYPGRQYPPRRPRIRENVNEAIRAREVRAVFPDGSVEVMPTQAAIRRAQELGLDLILVAPTAEPPVAKAMDYGQWQYENKKKQQEAKKKQHVIQVKEIKFRPNTDDHDYDFKKNHAIRFLQEGNRVKAVVQFRGREIAHVDLGKKLLLRFAADLVAVRRRRGPAAPGGPHRPRHHQPGEGRVRKEKPKDGGPARRPAPLPPAPAAGTSARSLSRTGTSATARRSLPSRRIRWRLVCRLKGRGCRTSLIPASSGVRLPLRLLQAWQQATRFSQVVSP